MMYDFNDSWAHEMVIIETLVAIGSKRVQVVLVND